MSSIVVHALHACDLRTQEVEARGSLLVPGYPGLYSETLSFKKQTNKTKQKKQPSGSGMSL